MAGEAPALGGLTWNVVFGAILSCALVHLGFSFFGVESMFHDWGNGLREMFNLDALPVHDHAHHAASYAFNDASGAGAAQAGYAYTPMGSGDIGGGVMDEAAAAAMGEPHFHNGVLHYGVD